jgi:hypothetical protein
MVVRMPKKRNRSTRADRAKRDEHRRFLRAAIEIGWRQSRKGNVVDGEGVFKEICAMSKSRRAKGRRNASGR